MTASASISTCHRVSRSPGSGSQEPSGQVGAVPDTTTRSPIRTALRLSKALGIDDRFWINIQTDDDLEIGRDRHGAELDKVVALVAD